jgi:hypothetical protein
MPDQLTSGHADVASTNKPGCPLVWPCNKPVGVRELLGLGPPYYFNIVPQSHTGATKYDVEWAQLSDPMGFKAKFGPTTAERRSPCFNQTQDNGECNWAGPYAKQLDPPTPSVFSYSDERPHLHPPRLTKHSTNRVCIYMLYACIFCSSWPYETARVLTGLANFLIDFPKAQSSGANVTATTCVAAAFQRQHRT